MFESNFPGPIMNRPIVTPDHRRSTKNIHCVGKRGRSGGLVPKRRFRKATPGRDLAQNPGRILTRLLAGIRPPRLKFNLLQNFVVGVGVGFHEDDGFNLFRPEEVFVEVFDRERRKCFGFEAGKGQVHGPV